jgi:sterol desaturase/sphingolipid hydroxylase (fatty acid hydroxylase superfamily)
MQGRVYMNEKLFKENNCVSHSNGNYWLVISVLAVATSLLWAFHSINFITPMIVKFAGEPTTSPAMRYLLLGINAIYVGLMQLIILATPFVLVEIYQKKERLKNIKKYYLFPISMWVYFLILNLTVIYLAARANNILDISPIIDSMKLSYWVHVAIWIIVSDFFIYWFHRLEHSVPIMWRFHLTHHSITEINVLNQYTHWLEGAQRYLFVILPVSIFVATPLLNVSIIALIYTTWAMYNHSDAQILQLPRWTRGFLSDNRFHHFHHAIDSEYHNRNFSNIFPVWDKIFGTYLVPSGGWFPKTGLSEIAPPKNLIEYLRHPLYKASPK